MARYEKGRKADTRRHIIETASRRLRADGVDAVGVATLMADAGLTNGGFYAHFDSKEDLIKEAVVHALAQMPGRLGLSRHDGSYDLAGFIGNYLSGSHRDHPADGCAVAALSTELSRRPAESRLAFQEEGRATIDRIASGLPGGTDGAERFARAVAVFSHLLGTLQMARFVTDTELSDQILTRGRREALHMAGLSATEQAT